MNFAYELQQREIENEAYDDMMKNDIDFAKAHEGDEGPIEPAPVEYGPYNEEGLLPCPFCGEFPELQDNRNGSYWYRCQNCGCALSTSDSIKDAKDNSNRRHT